MSELVYTHENKRVVSEGEIPTQTIPFNIHVNSLQELDNFERIERDYIQLYENILMLWSSIPSHNRSYRLNLRSKPVYVKKTGFGEEIAYNSNMMELGKLYEIEYKGEKWALRKNEESVQFMRFYTSTT